MTAAREKYTHLLGKQIRLLFTNDPYTDLQAGTKGLVDFIDDAGTVHVKWDDGSRLGLVEDDGDCWEVIS